MAESARVYPLRRQSPAKPRAEEPRLPEPESTEPKLPGPGASQPPPRGLRPQQPHPTPQRPHPQPPPEPLWREVLGQLLRTLRLDRQETLAVTAGRAGISPQYLSEIERGRKEPSSEMIAALAGALGTTLTELTKLVAGDLGRQADSSDVRRQPGTSAPSGSGAMTVLSLAA